MVTAKMQDAMKTQSAGKVATWSYLVAHSDIGKKFEYITAQDGYLVDIAFDRVAKASVERCRD